MLVPILILAFASSTQAEHTSNTQSKINRISALELAVEKIIEKNQHPAMAIGIIEMVKLFG